MVTTAVSSPCSDRILPAIASTGSGRAGHRIAELDLAAVALLARRVSTFDDERREVRVVGRTRALRRSRRRRRAR